MIVGKSSSFPATNVSLVQTLDRLGHWGHMTDDSATIFSQSVLQEVNASSAGMDRGVHSLMFIQHFLGVCDLSECRLSFLSHN